MTAGARHLVAAAAALVVCALTAAPATADVVRDAEWSLAAIQAPQAWATTRGEGVTVAVLDTGVDPGHADLSGQVVSGPDFVGGDARPGDPYWGLHGTAMASDVAGHGHGANAGVMGIAPAAKILSVRVIWDDNDPIRGMTPSQRTAAGARPGDPVARGIRYAVDNGAGVINMSLGQTDTASVDLTETDAAIRYAIDHGVVLVASDGNGGQTSNHTEFPAAYPGVIAVAATDRMGRRAGFSTHTWTTSVAAPGVGVVAAKAGGGYIIGDGTSPSAALVSGVCALVRARFPGLSPAQVREALERSATSRSGSYSEDLGWGVVQAAAALRLAATMVPEAATPQPAPARGRTFGDGRTPLVGLRALDLRLAALALLLLPLGGTCLAGAVLAAVLWRRPAAQWPA